MTTSTENARCRTIVRRYMIIGGGVHVEGSIINLDLDAQTLRLDPTDHQS